VNAFVTIALFAVREEALIARSLLASEGIEAFAPEFHQFSAMPHVGFGEGFRLQVRLADEAHARAILADAQANPA